MHESKRRHPPSQIPEYALSEVRAAIGSALPGGGGSGGIVNLPGGTAAPAGGGPEGMDGFPASPAATVGG